MKQSQKYLLLILSCMTLFSISCTKNETVGTYSYEGVDYNTLTGLDAESTELHDVRDNEVYSVVELGGKYWMAENLRYEAPEAMFNPDNPSKEYGYLYDWSTAKTACPKGWHLSSDAEWIALEETMGMATADLSVLGSRTLLELSRLKAQTGWRNGDNGSNTTLFSMLPAGRYKSEGFKNIGHYAFFWTSTLNTGNKPIGRYIFHGFDQVNRANIDQSIFQSCRCVLD